MRVIVVDDEPILLEALSKMLSNIAPIEVVGVYKDPLLAIQEIEVTQPEVAFLDIEMPGMNGIDLAERLAEKLKGIEIIFVTAYNHYAAQAFEVNAIDYLLKPIRPERLNKTIAKLKDKIESIPIVTQETVCKIKCFGAFEVLIGDMPLKWGRSKSKEFLAYMLQNEGRWISKYRLCDEQWTNYSQEQALAYLQTAVYLLRKNLRALNCKALDIEYANDRYRLRVNHVDWDMRHFESAYQNFLKTKSKCYAAEAAALYVGEYLEGEDWLWADLTRENLICQHEQLLEALNRI